MVKAFLVTLLLHAPIMLIIGGFICFLTQWSLRQHVFRKLIRAAVVFCLLVCAAGTLYGVLRFSGFIVFSDDNFYSYHWFDSSFRDNGFQYIYSCGSMLAGIIAAFFRGKNVGSQNHAADVCLDDLIGNES